MGAHNTYNGIRSDISNMEKHSRYLRRLEYLSGNLVVYGFESRFWFETSFPSSPNNDYHPNLGHTKNGFIIRPLTIYVTTFRG